MKTLTFKSISEADFALLLNLLDRLAVDYLCQEVETAISSVSTSCNQMTVGDVVTMLEEDEKTEEVSFEEHLKQMKQWKKTLPHKK